MPKASERAILLAKEVLAKIASYDPYFPKPNEAMLMAWAEHISLKNSNREDMLAAVTKFYETNTDNTKPLPANISMIARQMRQDRLMRGEYIPPGGPELPSAPPVSLKDWEQRHRDEYPDGFPGLKLGKDIPDVPVPPQYKRFSGNPKDVECSYCGAHPGEPCTTGGRPLEKSAAHPSRLEAAGAEPIPPSQFHV